MRKYIDGNSYIAPDTELPYPFKQFNEYEELESVSIQTGPQTRSPKPGVTREQFAQVFIRRNVYLNAEKPVYIDGQSTKIVIEQYLLNGYLNISFETVGVIPVVKMSNGNSEVVFKDKTSVKYIRLLLNMKIREE